MIESLQTCKRTTIIKLGVRWDESRRILNESVSVVCNQLHVSKDEVTLGSKFVDDLPNHWTLRNW